ncbi:Oxysterol-binding protein 3 [Fusarium falciforme]|uniref:Oxysterol-binding protein 3 n=2 Tax=Fusarium falciforme TaxID=195108 RepID=A0A9W8RB66_9HYPO|nr:Oxysterol-binding protein 3 [Fusarium falciforme]KAJ4191492.1 Oxysterol-binding protein 3 [Fusarium falciforme]KAJ4206574.1 Oxysterol-binding protein 3 [Fusarium falciforme]KAJ4261088.1 Oxysterol-binding protein 3, variant 2 [Fusarium falciforme]
MAGIEQLEVHSKSYIVRWVKVDEGNTLSWSVQPHKKSINFGLVKHPGSGATTLVSSTTSDFDAGAEETRGTSDGKASRFSKKDINAQDLLKNKGFIPIKWIGKCEADRVSIGTFEVNAGQSGMYGLVFDNTFSKQTSKTATFVVMTYPTGAPPQTSSHLPNLAAKAGASQVSLGRHSSPKLDGVASASFDSLHSHKAGGKATSVSGRSDGGSSSNYHVGTLHKRRRKKGQGYARRFFSLDYSTCTLSYYYNPKSSALRGAIPLSLAAIAADERRREISIDSGAEVWHLKAPNDREFQEWAHALEKASRVARGLETLDLPTVDETKINTRHVSVHHHQPSPHEDREWQQVEALVSRVVGTRDALRRLTKEVAAQSKPVTSPQYLSPGAASASTSAIDDSDTYFTPTQEARRSFWRRKSNTPAVSPATLGATTASALAVPVPGGVTTTISASGANHNRRQSKGLIREENSLQDHCQSLLTDLDSVVSEFTTLINNSKRRRMSVPPSAGAASRKSIDTVSTADEFFDAEDANSGVLKIDGSEDETPDSEEGDDNGDEGSFRDNSSISSIGENDTVNVDDAAHLFPAKPKSLTPLPLDQVVARRSTIPPTTAPAPSLIAFFRKNVGKDFSTISMPVTSNEPTSMCQKVAEQLEYAQLLNQAARQSSPTDRLLFVAAFAVSQFSSGRAKERAIRKPFTPLLGETFELVRTDKEVPGGFRLLVEKVQHRPLLLAMQADSSNWSFSQSPAPGQKFWGKSAEITTDGRVRIVLRLSNGSEERYSWNIATMFLRNVVMGEKYVEPVGTMHVVNDTTGHKAAVEFKSKGMWGGRTEDVSVEIFSPDGVNTGSGLTGAWTTGLKTSGKGGGQEIWRVGSLVENANQTYGLTTFAASLNEITEIEKGKLPPTDCRLRPDQRAYEQGKVDDAEEMKQTLEEAQRGRRRDLEERGETYKPRWFVKVENAPEGEEVWKLKTGKDSYWEERAKGTWQGVEENLFKLS